MAEAVRDAYADIFTVNENAQVLSPSQVAEAFKRVTGKGDAVAKKMASTFRALAKLADWNAPITEAIGSTASEAETDDTVTTDGTLSHGDARGSFSLRHDIHVHLPISTEVKVYDAIFRSLREHF